MSHNQSKENTISPDVLASAYARIRDLEDQIEELHEFIDTTGMIAQAPQSIQNQMEARMLAAQIEAKALEESNALYEETSDVSNSGVTSDDMSEAIMPHLREVEDVRNLPNGTTVAFDLVITLARCSYGDLNGHGRGYGDRPSDAVVDDLLRELASERRARNPSWDYSGALQALQDHAQELSEAGIEDFCSSTIELLSGWNDAGPL